MRRTGRRGLSLVEIVLAIGILSLAVVSMWQVFSGGYRMVYRTRYASMAAQVARETLEELQQMAHAASGEHLFRVAVHDPTGATVPDDRPETAAAAQLLRDWAESRAVVGPLFQISGAVLNPSEVSDEATADLEDLLNDPLLEYPPDYSRLHRVITFRSYAGDDERDILRARVTMTWEEKKEQQATPTAAIFETLIIREDHALLEGGGGG